MKHAAALTVVAIVLAGCHSVVPDAPAAPVPAVFSVDDMADGDGNITGCTTTLYRDTTRRHQIFVEDDVESGGVGYIRINGQLLKLDLTRSSHSDTGGLSVFTSADKDVQVVEDFLTGAAHQESDSVDSTGSLSVTYRGAVQSFIFTGGTAC